MHVGNNQTLIANNNWDLTKGVSDNWTFNCVNNNWTLNTNNNKMIDNECQ